MSFKILLSESKYFMFLEISLLIRLTENIQKITKDVLRILLSFVAYTIRNSSISHFNFKAFFRAIKYLENFKIHFFV